MVILLVLYISVILLYGFYWGIREKTFPSFIIAGRKQSTAVTLFSLMATMIGGSATLGVAANGYENGFPAFWWLAVGSFGLMLQAFFISGKVRDLKAATLAEVGRICVGENAAKMIALVVAVSWIGVIAGQFTALAQILSFFAGTSREHFFIILIAASMILFSLCGGQISVMRTDVICFFFILFGVIGTFSVLYFSPDQTSNFPPAAEIFLFNRQFTATDLISLLFIVGGTYFIGPDVLSRSMAAKDTQTARKASFLSAMILLCFDIVLMLIILWTRENISDPNGLNPLVFLMRNTLPRPVGFLLALSLISALLSSASTCLITAASTVSNDLLKRRSIKSIRFFIILIGIFATMISLKNSDIIAILTGAYAIYAPGIVFPLSIAILCRGKFIIKEKLWLLAVLVGGSCGIIEKIIHFPNLSLAGMFLSLLLSVLALTKKPF